MSSITVNENVIWDALRDTVERVKAGIDLEKAKTACKQRMGIASVDGLELKDGYAVSHEGQLAFRFNLRVISDLAILVDCQGNCIATFPENAAQPASPEQRAEAAGSQAAQSYPNF
jgi:glycine betaine/choline ABC-type transport system substrate-binding protein